GIADHGDVPVRLAARRDRPVDLAVVKNVHVVIDDDDAFHIEIRAEDRQNCVFRLTRNPLLDRNVAGERRGHTHGSDGRYHRARGAIKVGFDGGRREDQVIEMTDRNILENRVAPVSDRAHLKNFALALAKAVARELAEWTFSGPLTR